MQNVELNHINKEPLFLFNGDEHVTEQQLFYLFFNMKTVNFLLYTDMTNKIIKTYFSSV